MAEETKTVNNQKRVIILLVIVIIVLVAGGGALAYHFLNQGGGEGEGEGGEDNVPKLGYAEGTTVVRDSDALQKAVDEMVEKMKKGNVMLEYDVDAYSTDGQTFTGYLANAVENNYDAYYDMYTDSAFKDEIYLSGLLKPGTALEGFKTNRKLEKGDHTVYVAFTTVEDDHTSARSQILISMVLHVK